MWLWNSSPIFRKKLWGVSKMCQIRHQSPTGAIATGLYSSNSCVAFGRLTLSQCRQKAAHGSLKLIWVNYNFFPTEWFVVWSFVFMWPKCAPKKKYFSKVQRAFSYFRRMQIACSEATSCSYCPGLGTQKVSQFLGPGYWTVQCWVQPT